MLKLHPWIVNKYNKNFRIPPELVKDGSNKKIKLKAISFSVVIYLVSYSFSFYLIKKRKDSKDFFSDTVHIVNSVYKTATARVTLESLLKGTALGDFYLSYFDQKTPPGSLLQSLKLCWKWSRTAGIFEFKDDPAGNRLFSFPLELI